MGCQLFSAIKIQIVQNVNFRVMFRSTGQIFAFCAKRLNWKKLVLSEYNLFQQQNWQQVCLLQFHNSSFCSLCNRYEDDLNLHIGRRLLLQHLIFSINRLIEDELNFGFLEDDLYCNTLFLLNKSFSLGLMSF